MSKSTMDYKLGFLNVKMTEEKSSVMGQMAPGGKEQSKKKTDLFGKSQSSGTTK